MEKLGKYQLIREVGRGATARVYEARHSETGSLVALKVFHPGLFGGPSQIRIRRELDVSTALKHPNIVPVIEILDLDPPVIVMKHIDGESLEEFQSRLPYLLPEIAALIGIEILKGIAEAHSKSVVHRDLKPANILISKHGEVFVSDFGLAKLHGSFTITEPNMLVGSLDYLSPEQANGEEVTNRSDIFSIGAILYFLMTGTRPFSRPSPTATLTAIRTEAVVTPQQRNPKISSRLQSILLRALEKNPKLRHATALEMNNELRNYLNQLDLTENHFSLREWFSDPSGVAMSALQTSAHRLVRDAEKHLEESKSEDFLGSIAELNQRAPDSPAKERLLASYALNRRKGKTLRVAVLALGVLLILVALVGWIKHRTPDKEIELVNLPLPVTQYEAPPPSLPASPPAKVEMPQKKKIEPKKIAPAVVSTATKVAVEPPLLPASVSFKILDEVAEVFWDYKQIRNGHTLRSQQSGSHVLIVNYPGLEVVRKHFDLKAGTKLDVVIATHEGKEIEVIINDN